VNLACSGAKSVDVLRSAAGGVGQNGQPTQDDQLAALARTDDVRLVVLTVGGNDIGFGTIVNACVGAYLGATSEWVRFVDLLGQGNGESMHPDHFGQMALGGCLALVLPGFVVGSRNALICCLWSVLRCLLPVGFPATGSGVYALCRIEGECSMRLFGSMRP